MRALNLLLAVACAMGLARAASLIFLHVPLDPNEGWNAYHAAAAIAGTPLYPHGPFVNNYPPLSFYAVGILGGDHIFAGRIVSLTSLLAVAAAIFASLRAMEAPRGAALFGALWFVGGMLVFTDYVAMDDPQLLGHAAALAGLLLLLRGHAASAALAMAAALFVKHNLVALPLASLAWLALTDRHKARGFAAAGIAAGALGLASFRLVYGVDLPAELVSPRLYSLSLMAESASSWLAWGGTAMLVTASLAFARSDRNTLLVALYALTSVLVGTAFSGGAGVDTNAWFDAAIAVALGSALALDGLSVRAWHAPALAGAIVLPLIVGTALHEDWPGAEDSADSDIAFLREHGGPAICEMLSLCYWAGKPQTVDVFNLGQAYATKARSDDALVAQIAARRFGAIEFDSLDPFALTPRVKQAVLANYRIDHVDDNGVFLVRRSRP
jgi:hypothetical protein